MHCIQSIERMMFAKTMGIVAIVCAFGSPALAEPLDLVITPRPPYYTVDQSGAVSGIVAGPARKIFENAGLEAQWSVVSFNRQLQMIEDNSHPLCAVGWFKTSEREKFAKFTDYIYQDRALVALSRADNQAVTAYHDLHALMGDKSLTMGAKLGFSYGTDVDGLIGTLAPKAITTDQSTLGMARMLIGRRFDYMISAPEEAAHMIEALGSEGATLAIIAMQDLMPRNKRYIMCSLSVDDDVIERLNAAIRSSRP